MSYGRIISARLFTAQPSKAGVCKLHITYHIVLHMQGRVLGILHGYRSRSYTLKGY